MAEQEQLLRDLDRFVALLKQRLGPALVSVVLYGSRARGTHRPDSDLDLLVVAEGLPGGWSARDDLIRPLSQEVSEEFAHTLLYTPLTPEEARRTRPYYLGMLSGHRILYDRDAFFAGVLDRRRARLAELGSKRLVDADGYEYWDLKPDWKPGDVVEL